MTKNQVTIVESWKLSYRNEVLADIQHSLSGLMPETILTSIESGLRWKVISRIIFTQAENKRFAGENEHFQHISFAAPGMENLERFQHSIVHKESHHIYHYALEPIGHTNKPRGGEQLQVEMKNNAA